MVEPRLRRIEESDFSTLIAGDVQFDGTLTCSEPVLIKGVVTGDVRAEAEVYVGGDARVEAMVSAPTVSVHGTVRGDVTARKRVELFAGSTLTGNLTTQDLIVQSGCRFNGECRMPEPTRGDADA